MADSLFIELKRRNVFKVGTAYLVLAWIVVQVTSLAIPALHLPEWINTAVFFFGVIGFPFALFFAWAFEITPEGIKKESEISREESIADHTGRKLDFIIIGMLVIALAYFIFESRFEAQATSALVADNIASETNTDTPKEDAKPEGSSIAVLPFVNMSSDKEQEYFSDGISEEILNVLAKIPNLHVTSRSSAFFYKNTKINISEVAAKLGVNNILEGSVRKSGNRIRITAQLIEAGSDKHLWSETYDRELTDIFAIQDEISAAIVKALKTKLGLNVNLVARDMSMVNIDAHNEYLKGRFYIENRNQTDLEKALAHFNKAIEFAPDYALAWMGKAWAIKFLSTDSYGDLPRKVSFTRASSAIKKALILNPNLPEAHAIMGIIESDNLNSAKAIVHLKKAIELNPNYADALIWYGGTLFKQPKKRLALFHRAVQLSPMSMLANNNYALDLVRYGRIDEALAVLKHMLSINAAHSFPFQLLGSINLAQGKVAEAIIAYERQIKYSPHNIGARLNAAELLATIGLGAKAASYLEGTIDEHVKYWFLSNDELYISEVRATFPRSKDDSQVHWERAQAEVIAENYKEASKYFELENIEGTSNARIYSYLQIGETSKAKILLAKNKLALKTLIAAGIKYSYYGDMLQPITLGKMEIAVLEGDIERAIGYLKQVMEQTIKQTEKKAAKQNYIVSFTYQKSPIYKKLRAHPDWPDIMAESNKRAAVQRKMYLKLVSVESNL